MSSMKQTLPSRPYEEGFGTGQRSPARPSPTLLRQELMLKILCERLVIIFFVLLRQPPCHFYALVDGIHEVPS